ncbi:MAG: hypothetical protein DMF91_19605 [Acidobacteria bacterium]|nr:MAG: hypothetical protein DMF91_19605 [Acidobacteriota bacterium]
MRITAFVAVGTVGFLVQLAVLAALLAAGCPYLPATAAAVEAAVLHNFLWHEPNRRHARLRPPADAIQCDDRIDIDRWQRRVHGALRRRARDRSARGERAGGRIHRGRELHDFRSMRIRPHVRGHCGDWMFVARGRC